jgi:hypothetical protein
MRSHLACAIGALCVLASLPPALRGQAREAWRAASDEPQHAGGSANASAAPRNGPSDRVSRTGTLPNDHGQVWREYDIRDYTSRAGSQEKPEQAVVDWILRETGTDAWFGETVSLLSVDPGAVRVYHTPEIQDRVNDIVERFVGSRPEAHQLLPRLMTLGSPDWRLKAMPMLRSVPVQTPGVEAWLLSRENAALLLAELKKRTDYREHNSPNLAIDNGQLHTIRSVRPRAYPRALQPGQAGFTGYQTEMGQVEEGFTLQLSALISRDRTVVDAVVKCSVDQVERLAPLWLDVNNPYGSRQRAQIYVPQVAGWRLHERFRWPVGEVLLISRGLAAAPSPDNRWTGTLTDLLDFGPPRAEALLLLEVRGEVRPPQAARSPGVRTSGLNYRGRY